MQFTLYLIAQVHTVIVQESHFLSAMEGILQVDEIADQGIQFIDLRHTGNTKSVELVNQSLLKFLVCLFSVLLNVPCDKALFIRAARTSAVPLAGCAICTT